MIKIICNICGEILNRENNIYGTHCIKCGNFIKSEKEPDFIIEKKKRDEVLKKEAIDKVIRRKKYDK